LSTRSPIVPVYRALTIAGNVLDRDEQGMVYHTVVVDTTMTGHCEVRYTVIAAKASR